MSPKFLTDTDRLNYILKFFKIHDIGDEIYVPGICIDVDRLEDRLTWTTSKSGTRINQCDRDDMRAIIDIAIYKETE